MIALPNDLPMITWQGKRTVPLSPGWLAESISTSLETEPDSGEWQWTEEVVQALCYYLKNDYLGSEIEDQKLLGLIRHSISSMGYPDLSPKVKLLAPRVVISLPELAQSSHMELVFFQNLQSKLDEAFITVVRGIKLEGIRSTVKSLQGTRRWKKSCQTLNDEIVLFTRKTLEQWNQPIVDLVIK